MSDLKRDNIRAPNLIDQMSLTDMKLLITSQSVKSSVEVDPGDLQTAPLYKAPSLDQDVNSHPGETRHSCPTNNFKRHLCKI